MAARLLIIAIVAAVLAGCGGVASAPVRPVDPAAVVSGTDPVTTKFCSFTLTNGVTLQGMVMAESNKEITIRTEDGDLTIAKVRLARTVPAPLPQAFDQEVVSSVKEGIESLSGWGAASWGNPGTVMVEKVSGDLRLRIKAESGAAEKAAVRVATGLDLSANAALMMDVFNPSKVSAVVALAVVTGEGRVYFESQPMEVPFGWSRKLTVDLTAAQFKSEASMWDYTTVPTDLETVSELYILVYNGEQPVEIVANNLFVQ